MRYLSLFILTFSLLTTHALAQEANDRNKAAFVENCRRDMLSNAFLKMLGFAIPEQKVLGYCLCNYNYVVENVGLKAFVEYDQLARAQRMKEAYQHPAREGVEQGAKICGEHYLR